MQPTPFVRWIMYNFLVCVATVAGASTLVTIRDEQQEYDLTANLEIFEDVGQKLTIEEVSSPAFAQRFNLNRAKYPHAAHPESAYWIRINILNRSERKWVLEVLSLQTQDLQLYIPTRTNQFQRYQTGQHFRFDHRVYAVKNFLFDIPDRQQEVYPLYIRVVSDNGVSFEYKIRTQTYFTHYTTGEYYFLGLFYGFLLFLVMYMFLLFITSGEKAYLYYILYLLSCLLLSLEGDGLGFQYLWPHFPQVNTFVSSYWSSFLFLLAYLLYAFHFMELKHIFPRLHLLLISLVVLYLGTEMSRWFPGMITTCIYLLPFVLLYGVAIDTYRKGAKANLYFIIGHTFLLISIFITRSSWSGFFDSTIFTVYSFNYAVIIEAILFSYAFIYKYKLIKKDKEQAQQEIINQLNENKVLQTKVNRELEQKVAERTGLLEQEKEKLREANEQLEIWMAEVNRINSKLDYDNWQLNKKVGLEKKARIMAEEVSYQEFQAIFPNEFSCLQYLEELKWGKAYKCRRCENTKYISLKKLLSRRCSKCAYIESVTAATLFHSIKFPLHKAFYIVYHCSFSTNKMTIDELASLLDLSRNTCWSFKKKVVERMLSIQKTHRDTKKWEVLILE